MSTVQDTTNYPDVILTDPREAFAKPPYSKQKPMTMPGSTSDMNPTPDHGEDSYVGSGKLKGLNAIITGADSGIGRAIAIAYAREGANVVITYLSEDADAEQTESLVQDAGVNAVAPGPVWTPFIPGSISKEKFEKFGAETLFERPAQPAELAPMYVWLASPEASYVTAEVYGCTGGLTPF